MKKIRQREVRQLIQDMHIIIAEESNSHNHISIIHKQTTILYHLYATYFSSLSYPSFLVWELVIILLYVACSDTPASFFSGPRLQECTSFTHLVALLVISCRRVCRAELGDSFQFLGLRVTFRILSASLHV